MTNLQELAVKYGVEPFPFGEPMSAELLLQILRAKKVPEEDISAALEADRVETTEV